MPEQTFNLAVSPGPVQDPNPDHTVGPFPFFEGCYLSIRAEGEIGSGVVLTCKTAPGGWPDWIVGGAETEWPCRDGRATRYGLIARFDDGPFFFVGGDQSVVGDVPHAEPPPTTTLRFAVNRPFLDRRAAGDGTWRVTVELYVPDGTSTDRRDPRLCAILTRQIAGRREAAPMLCTAIEGSVRAIDARWNEIMIAGQVAGVFLVGLLTVSLPFLIPQGVVTAAQWQTALQTAQATIRALVAPLTPSGPISAALAGAVSAAIAPASLALTTTSGAAAGAANASPIGLTPWGRALIIAATICLVASVGVTIGLLLSQIQLSADNANARVNWRSMILGLQRDLQHAPGACGRDDIDGTLPVCAAAGG